MIVPELDAAVADHDYSAVGFCTAAQLDIVVGLAWPAVKSNVAG